MKKILFGMVGRNGQCQLRVLDNVQQQTIKPVLEACVKKGSMLHTDEYVIYDKVTKWGFEHHSVEHAKGEYAQDKDGDGIYEVHCNTQEGIWSLLRSWLRPHRGVSQEKLPFYVGFFEWVHNLKMRGKHATVKTFALLLTPNLRKYQDCLLSVQLPI